MTESNLVIHARRELTLVREDPEIVDATMRMVEAFAECGHSGASAHFHIEMIARLLRYGNLAPLTNDPTEWLDVADHMWQNRRNGEAFSTDGGRTYYLLSERKRRRWPRKGWSKPMHTAAPALAKDGAQ